MGISSGPVTASGGISCGKDFLFSLSRPLSSKDSKNARYLHHIYCLAISEVPGISNDDLLIDTIEE